MPRNWWSLPQEIKANATKAMVAVEVVGYTVVLE
jgi:hypothetical protein